MTKKELEKLDQERKEKYIAAQKQIAEQEAKVQELQQALAHQPQQPPVDIIQKTINALVSKKIGIIAERVNANFGLDINVVEELNKKFPMLSNERNPNDLSEHWLWNDGSPDGFHLVSFYESSISPAEITDDGLGKYTIEIGFTYT